MSEDERVDEHTAMRESSRANLTISAFSRLQNTWPGYGKVVAEMESTFNQLTAGKGHDRHAGKHPEFLNQHMMQIAMQMGSDHGLIYQAQKKILESMNPGMNRAYKRAEIMGAINYLYGVLVFDTLNSKDKE